MDRGLLFLSYLFPPRGGAGVQRAAKFAKYLPQFGWRPLVVTSADMADDYVTTRTDQTLLADLPDLPGGGMVCRTQLTDAERRDMRWCSSKWGQRLAPTDPAGWWVGPAVRAARELLARQPARAILVTMSPFTSAEAGIRLKRLTGLPLALDLRDPWALDETKVYPTRLHAWRDWCAMARALESADLVIMNTPAAMRAAARGLRVSHRSKMVCITNGFDGDDLGRVAVDPAPPDVLRVVHTGMFHSELASVWDDLYARRGWMNKLKFCRRRIDLWSRTPRYLLAAIEQAIRQGSIPSGGIELVLVGEITAGDQALVEASPVASHVRILGYQPHDRSVAHLRSADLLFLPNHRPLDGGPALIVPGKTYEYLGSGRPILAMGSPGDMHDMIRSTNAGYALRGDDVAGAATVLAEACAAKRAGRPPAGACPGSVARYERRAVTQLLAAELDEMLERIDRVQAAITPRKEG